MSGLGGLNESPAGAVIGLVQLQLPVVSTTAEPEPTWTYAGPEEPAAHEPATAARRVAHAS